jgi:DNA-binding transcriptional regulator YiaG
MPQFKKRYPAPNPSEIEAARAKLGLTQDQTAKLLDVSPRTYDHWAAGTARIQTAAAVLLAHYAAGNLPLPKDFKQRRA